MANAVLVSCLETSLVFIFYTEIIFNYSDPFFFSELVFRVLKSHGRWHININRSRMENNNFHVFRLDIGPTLGQVFFVFF